MFKMPTTSPYRKLLPEAFFSFKHIYKTLGRTSIFAGNPTPNPATTHLIKNHDSKLFDFLLLLWECKFSKFKWLLHYQKPTVTSYKNDRIHNLHTPLTIFLNSILFAANCYTS